MHTSAKSSSISVLQIEQARAIAKLAPGAVFDASADPTGTVSASAPIDDRSPPAITLVRSELSETPNSQAAAIVQSLLGPLQNGSRGRYFTFVDLDNDSSTGCAPGSAGFPTTLSGIEVVTAVSAERPGGDVVSHVGFWRCEAGNLVEVREGITAEVVNIREVHTGAFLLSEIKTVFDKSLLSPRHDVVRLQAAAEMTLPIHAINRLPVDDKGAVVSLVPGGLPVCRALAPVVNPGSATLVRGEGLPPNVRIQTMIGGRTVSNGTTDSEGNFEVSAPIASNSRGVLPITISVEGKAIESTCVVEVVGASVTPVTTLTIYPPPNESGWNNSAVSAVLTSESGGSPVASISYQIVGPTDTIPMTTWAGRTAAFNINTQGRSLVSFYATDENGLSEHEIVQAVSIDLGPPTVTGNLSHSPNEWGWNNQDVSVRFECQDSISGVSDCPPTVVIKDEGAEQFIAGDAHDRAGNLSRHTVGGINIDKTPPTIEISGPSRIVLNASAAVEVNVSDALSGVAAQSLPNGMTSLDTRLVGPKTLVVNARDIAGNETSRSKVFSVEYDFVAAGGFLPPHNNPPAINSWKAGANIPIRFRLADGSENFVTDPGAVVSLTSTPVACSPFGAPIGAPVVIFPSSEASLKISGSTYHINWKTSKTENKQRDGTGCSVVDLNLNDGTSHSVFFQNK
jgi:hypothetical protein